MSGTWGSVTSQLLWEIEYLLLPAGFARSRGLGEGWRAQGLFSLACQVLLLAMKGCGGKRTRLQDGERFTSQGFHPGARFPGAPREEWMQKVARAILGK